MNSRFVALDILYKIFEKNEFSNKLLNKMKKTSNLSSKDIGFIFKLVYGTIQYKIYLEYVVNKIIDVKKTSKKIQILLWMGLYQAKFLNTPNYSVVYETVEVAKIIESNSCGFVNIKMKALLDKDLWKINIKNKQNILPLKYGFPFWLYKQIQKDYGPEVAEKIVKTSNDVCKISFRININKISIEDFFQNYKNNFEFEKSLIAKDGYLVDSDFLNTDAFLKGYIYIQDETSMLASELLAPLKNKKILDMCCAPGGKLTHLAQMVGKETIVFGNELNSQKKQIIEENLKLAGVDNVVLSFKPEITSEEQYDFIMLDVPCSGFGVLKRKPEIKLKKHTIEEMNQLYETQQNLLDTAYKLLAKNGKLIYSTCTINKLENQNQIKKFLQKYLDMKLLDIKQYFGFEGNNNGFFIAHLLKK